MTGTLSPWHILVVAAVFLLFFGAKRMPDAARGLGSSMRIFKAEINQMDANRPEEDATVARTPHPPGTSPLAQTHPADEASTHGHDSPR
ncbi:Sec-independent protein translocase subunit TatA [Nocardia sp. NPDC004711]